MRHASVELLEAMKGVVPVNIGRPDASNRAACTTRISDLTGPALVLAWASPDSGPSQHEHRDPVTCPDCLLLMCRATDPMRWDTLLERGLVQPLVGVER